MKIAIAQIESIRGDINANILRHQKLIQEAISKGADAIFFPELSLTNYEPTLAKSLIINDDSKALSIFQEMSDTLDIIISIGAPTQQEELIFISAIIFQPHQSPIFYSKRYLHEDEQPYFSEGEKQEYVTIKDHKIALAICYESLLPKHAEEVFNDGATIYLASVAKPQRGYEKGIEYYPQLARKYNVPVLMANCIGDCDNFKSVGKSSIWNAKGELLAQMDEVSEGILIYDTDNKLIP